jgi:2-methylisocitrate lyase-like PEP mutase family enzyme
VSVPVTADVEAGYGPTPEDVRRTVRGVLEAGAVGINLEDGNAEPGGPLADRDLQVEKIRAARDEAGRMGVPIVVNARTDVYLDGSAPRKGIDLAIRNEAYRRRRRPRFVFGLTDGPTIGEIVRRLGCPVNVPRSGQSSDRRARAPGVARFSARGRCARLCP